MSRLKRKSISESGLPAKPQMSQHLKCPTNLYNDLTSSQENTHSLSGALLVHVTKLQPTQYTPTRPKTGHQYVLQCTQHIHIRPEVGCQYN